MSETVNPAAFPRIEDPQHLETIKAKAGEPQRFEDGEILWNQGDEGICVFIVKSGRIAIVEPACDPNGSETLITTHSEGNFTGDIDVLAGRPSVVAGRADGPLEAWRISNDDLREIVRLDQDLGALLMRAMLARREILEREGTHGVRVVGSRFDPDTHKIREFLSRNRILHHWLRPEDPDIGSVFRTFGRSGNDLPIVIVPGLERVLARPSLEELAREVGVLKPMDGEHYDLVVVGAGPAGLAAAVYGGSEGLRTLVVDAVAPGGQASWSSRIENYMGFPEGLTGTQLADAGRRQAEKFGAVISAPARVEAMTCDDGSHRLTIRVGDGDSETVSAGCVVLATGATYRKLPAEGFTTFEGKGIYYAATETELETCRDAEVAVVGAGNSAGQAVVFLARSCAKVRLIVRGEDIRATMSEYLACRIETSDNVEVMTQTEVSRIEGGDRIERLTLSTGETVPCQALFCFIGATPNTDLVKDIVATDDKGYILTGADIPPARWRPRRAPHFLETTCPGLLAAGDCRAGSVKRVAGAVGEGAMAVAFAHRILAE